VGGQSRHFAYLFQVSDDAMQMNVYKTLYPFHTKQKMFSDAATVANSAHSKTWFSTFFMQRSILQLNLT